MTSLILIVAFAAKDTLGGIQLVLGSRTVRVQALSRRRLATLLGLFFNDKFSKCMNRLLSRIPALASTGRTMTLTSVLRFSLGFLVVFVFQVGNGLALTQIRCRDCGNKFS